MKRSIASSLLAACFILLDSGRHGFVEGFLPPTTPSQRFSFLVDQQRVQKQRTLQSFKGNGQFFSFAGWRQKSAVKNVKTHRRSWPAKFRRSAGMLISAALLWFGAAAFRTNPSHASSTTSAPSISKSSASLEKMVDGYVQDHMYDDDVYEPVESVYREAFNDKTKASYPRTLSEVTSSVLGKDGVKTDEQKSASGIGGLLLNSINFLQRKAGLSETAAIIVLTGSFVVAGPFAFVFAGMMVAGQSKRQINAVMKKRYGDTYTVDASIKVEEDVELPDDEDEVDDDGDNDDGDNDGDEKDK